MARALINRQHVLHSSDFRVDVVSKGNPPVGVEVGWRDPADFRKRSDVEDFKAVASPKANWKINAAKKL